MKCGDGGSQDTSTRGESNECAAYLEVIYMHKGRLEARSRRKGTDRNDVHDTPGPFARKAQQTDEPIIFIPVISLHSFKRLACDIRTQFYLTNIQLAGTKRGPERQTMRCVPSRLHATARLKKKSTSGPANRCSRTLASIDLLSSPQSKGERTLSMRRMRSMLDVHFPGSVPPLLSQPCPDLFHLQVGPCVP